MLLVGPITLEAATSSRVGAAGAPWLRLGALTVRPDGAPTGRISGEPIVVLGRAVLITPGRLVVVDGPTPTGLAVTDGPPTTGLAVTAGAPNRIEVTDGW